MKRLTPLALALIATFLSPPALAAQEKPSGPNVLFVLIDDMGYRDLACFGGTRAKTPAIDKLAAEGMKFAQFYVASPICSPSRTGLLTGQYPGRWRITSFLASREENAKRGLADWLDPMAPTVARVLHGAGYYTAHVGKWHMGGQRDISDAPFITEYGFDEALGSMEAIGDRVVPVFEPQPDGKPTRHGPSASNVRFGRGKVIEAKRHDVTARYVDRATEAIAKARAAGKPFYVHLWLDDVHSPMQAPPDRRGDGTPAAQYVGVMEEMDRQLGRIFDAIRSDPALRDNTLVLLASDNGHEQGLGSAGELRGWKGQLYEGGIRSPLIAWWPGGMEKSAVGTTNETTVICGIDVCPSLAALAGAAPPPEGVRFDGVDLSAALAGRSRAPRPAPVMWVRPPDRPGPGDRFPDLAMRDGQWKLLVERDGSQAHLYDVVADPNEKTDLTGQHADRVKQMTEQVIRWDKEVNWNAPEGPRSKPTGK